MKKNTGMMRKLDELGRVVIPIGLRKKLNINKNDSLEIYIDSNKTIILKKYERSCIFCNNNNSRFLKKYNNTLICKTCLNKLSELN